MSTFKINSDYQPRGDQGTAIESLAEGINTGEKWQTLLGVTGSGKTFTVANVIEQINRPTLVLSHNKTLVAQLYGEFKALFPENAVEFFISYYDYYQPEAYMPATDTFIEKDADINEEIDRLRLRATSSLLERRDVIIVSSVSCIYGLGSPQEYEKLHVMLNVGDVIDRDDVIRNLVDIHYTRSDFGLERANFRVRGDVLEIVPAYDDRVIRIEFFGDTVEAISEVNKVSGKVVDVRSKVAVYPAKHFVTTRPRIESAILEIQNEDSHFFYTFKKDSCPPARWDTLKSLYAQWLVTKYGSLNQAIAAWNHKTHAGDSPAQGRMELLDAWYMTTDGSKNPPVPRQRIKDQVHFLTDNMRGFYEQAIGRFRSEGNYQGLVSCGNWHTADARMLDALERYCYTAGDVIDRHGYFSPPHGGDASSYSVRKGQNFHSESALHLLRNNPLPFVETEGFPSIISEIGWPMPNMYRAESTFLCAAYGAMLGMDGIFHFAVGSAGWDQQVGKFILNNPAALGGYFAPALVYRLQYVQEAPVVVRESLALNDLLDLQGSAAYVRPALDKLREDQTPGHRAMSQPLGSDVDPTAFYIGRVVRDYRGQPGQSGQQDLSPFLNRQTQTIRSVTDELHWHYGAGVATMNTPKAQGAAGFLGAKSPIVLDTVTIDMENDYGTVLAVALDDLPLAESHRVLIQCTTLDQPYGWHTSEPNGLAGTIEEVGGAPWGMQRCQATVSLPWAGPDSVAVVACDENGYATDKPVALQRDTDRVLITIEETSAYTIVTR